MTDLNQYKTNEQLLNSFRMSHGWKWLLKGPNQQIKIFNIWKNMANWPLKPSLNFFSSSSSSRKKQKQLNCSCYTPLRISQWLHIESFQMCQWFQIDLFQIGQWLHIELLRMCQWLQIGDMRKWQAPHFGDTYSSSSLSLSVLTKLSELSSDMLIVYKDLEQWKKAVTTSLEAVR